LQQAHPQSSPQVQWPLVQQSQHAQAFGQSQPAGADWPTREVGSKNENSIKAVYME
jgi:hypothetical protein